MNTDEFRGLLSGIEQMHGAKVQIQSISSKSTQDNEVFTLETDSRYMYATVSAFTKKQESISLADETDH